MNVGDRAVLLKGLLYSSAMGDPQLVPQPGEFVTIEHICPPEHYPNGKVTQSVWVHSDLGYRLCTWTEFIAICQVQSKNIPVLKESVPPFLFRRRRIELDGISRAH